jgi:hypothetical protein
MCDLKGESGIINPTIALQLEAGNNPAAYNYAYIPDFDRYYYVLEWTFSSGLWLASMNVDALASWKGLIGNSSEYILRCSYESDGEILDTFYPAKTHITTDKTEYADRWTGGNLNNGNYVVGIINADGAAVGAVSYYVFNQTQMRALCQELLSSADWLNIDAAEISADLAKTLFNPFQYIISCLWFPYSVPKGSSVSSLEYGWWTLPVSCWMLGYAYTIDTFAEQVNMPKHPQAATRGDYLNGAPYSQYTLEYMPYGQIPIPGVYGLNSSVIFLRETLDYITGSATLTIHGDAGAAEMEVPITTVKAQLGVPIQLAQVNTDPLGVVGGVANSVMGIGSFVTGNFAAGIASVGSGIVSAIEAMAPQVQTGGSNGSIGDIMAYGGYVTLTGRFCEVAEEDNEHCGRPLMAVRQINTIPGYIMVANADIEIPATADENKTIKQYMEAGFFYE